ncbi:uncharacterized protein DUF4255 [Neolewinella xylanilytica]|uniref:Uncharacterized protein DUF4255 n=1 Tax=Neolewinella xylanilytica TaxID=1514080 RepID=A0A2S6I8X8_9BACT|nr:DUF4255 domain-containing protein [Neolewinella xylanilytica]PPK87929.1 uncharacterized protein DUF4255 [Neolewinella xylanilytica]
MENRDAPPAAVPQLYPYSADIMPIVQDRVSDLLMTVRGYLQTQLGTIQTTPLNRTVVGNIGRPELEGIGDGEQNITLTDSIVLTLVRTEEDPSRKNQRNYRVNPLATDDSNGILYRNPPVGLNLYVLITANHSNYLNAMTLLSHVIAIFQHRNKLTDDGTVAWPGGGTYGDQILKFSLLSPSFEEQNHLWGMLGGKQIPSVLYLIQTANVELLPENAVTGPPITEIVLNESLR